MPLSHILILGAGPAGLSAALSLSALPTPPDHTPLRITVLELRPHVSTLGGAINLTPVALRYLDRLGVGGRIRERGVALRDGMDLLSLRTGGLMGSLWKGVDAVRVSREEVVRALVDKAEGAERVEVRFGVRVVEILEEGEEVVLRLEDGDTVRGDVLLGCDGLHSVARRLYVEPERREEYSGKAVAYGFVDVEQPGEADIKKADGGRAVVDTTLVSARTGSLLTTFFEPSRKQLYLAVVMSIKEEHEDSKEGWRARGKDREQVREDILSRFQGGKLDGLTDVLERCQDWSLYPVYVLPPNGQWSRGKVLLLGDAAHAMPPQGESTGVAIEDGVLVARVLSRHDSRDVTRLFRDYETLRRDTIDKLYKPTTWNWKNAAGGDSGWLWNVVIENVTPLVLMMMNWRQKDHFAGDVNHIQLPP